jgi:GT2 family glycosyltransferase
MGLNPLVEISVAIHNQWIVSNKFFKSLFASIASYDSVAVNIIDNASTDSTVVELDKYSDKATIFNNQTNKGFAFAHNMILRKSFAPFSCILHNDVILSANWLNKLVGVMQENPKLGILGVVNDVFGLFQIGGRLEQDGSAQFVYQSDDDQKIDFVCSSCMLIKNNVFKAIGYFDEKFVLGWNSDIDLCVRAQEAGFEIGLCENIIINHTMGSTAKVVGVDRYKEENRMKLVQKNKDWIEKEKGKVITRKQRKVE